MTDDEEFRSLIARIRSGDQAAAAELVRQYESEIRRTVRLQLGNSRLNRSLDSIDVTQSVLGNVFVRIASGQLELKAPRQLLALLLKMAHNKVVDHARKAANRHEPLSSRAIDRTESARRTTPSEIVDGLDLLEQVRACLNDEEKWIFDQRRRSVSWTTIAASLGDSSDAIRKRYERTIDRVNRQLGLMDD